MTKTKRIVCPHCRSAHMPGTGYHFDEDLSLICDKCSKTIFPTIDQAEVGIPKAADRRYPNNRGHHQAYGGWQEYETTDIVFA